MGFNPGNGGSSSISGSTDVFINNIQTGQVLTYDVNIWKNLAASGGITAAKNTATSGNVTLTAGTSAILNKYAATLSANRTITLASASANAWFELSFIDTVFGGFTLTVTDGTFSHVFSYPTYVKYVYIGSAWERVL
jgi:hypothetical protein